MSNDFKKIRVFIVDGYLLAFNKQCFNSGKFNSTIFQIIPSIMALAIIDLLGVKFVTLASLIKAVINRVSIILVSEKKVNYM